MIDQVQAFEALKTFDWGGDVAALKPIDEAVIATRDKPDARAELEKQLIAALEGDLKRASKDFVCRILTVIGTAASVPALNKLLAQPDDAQLARFALERIPAAEARQALLAALSTSTGPQLIGVIGSLGARGESESVDALSGLLNNSEETVGRAAARSLGAIRNAEAAKALDNANAENDVVKMAIIDARLSCAEAFLAAGKNGDALAIYKSLVGDDQPKHVKLGATRGMLACAGKK